MFTATSRRRSPSTLKISVDNLTDAGDFGLAQFVDATLGRDAHPLANVTRT